jgi:hypothetical protein
VKKVGGGSLIRQHDHKSGYLSIVERSLQEGNPIPVVFQNIR